jgi:hypothetical protein
MPREAEQSDALVREAKSKDADIRDEERGDPSPPYDPSDAEQRETNSRDHAASDVKPGKVHDKRSLARPRQTAPEEAKTPT